MKTCAKLGLHYLFLLFEIISTCCCDSPIEEYKPKNKDEKEIISVLIQYQAARNRFDLQSLLSTLHENGEFSFQ